MSVSDSEILATMFRCGTLGETMAQAAFSLGTSRSAVAGILKRCRDARAEVEARRLRDHEVKAILDRMFFEGQPADRIGRAYRISRNAVLYLVWWVMNDLHAAGPEQVMDPGNAEVIDWPLWWRRTRAAEVAA